MVFIRALLKNIYSDVTELLITQLNDNFVRSIKLYIKTAFVVPGNAQDPLTFDGVWPQIRQ